MSSTTPFSPPSILFSVFFFFSYTRHQREPLFLLIFLFPPFRTSKLLSSLSIFTTSSRHALAHNTFFSIFTFSSLINMIQETQCYIIIYTHNFLSSPTATLNTFYMFFLFVCLFSFDFVISLARCNIGERNFHAKHMPLHRPFFLFLLTFPR